MTVFSLNILGVIENEGRNATPLRKRLWLSQEDSGGNGQAAAALSMEKMLRMIYDFCLLPWLFQPFLDEMQILCNLIFFKRTSKSFFFPPVSRLLSQKAKYRESPAVISLHQQCPSFPSYFPLSPPFHLPQEYSKKWQREPLKAWPTPVQEMCKGTNRIVPDRDWEKHTGARCAQLDVCVCVLPSSCTDRLCLWHLIPTHCKRLIL